MLFDAATQNLRYVANHDSFDALAPGATATDSFTYTIVDASGLAQTATVTVTITGLNDGVRINAGNGNNNVSGTAGEDRLYGENGNDNLLGGDGHDLLDGGRGNDVLNGQAGNDTLAGGKGADQLTGGLGHDLFVFGADNGTDLVLDFDKLTDSIRLADGISISSTSTLDANGDGLADLRLEFDDGGAAILLGISSMVGVQVEGTGSAQQAWQESLATLSQQPAFTPFHGMHGSDELAMMAAAHHA